MSKAGKTRRSRGLMRRLGCGVAISAAMSGAFVPAAMASSVSPAAASRLSAPMSAPVISDTVLDRMRGIGDPAADRVVAALTARGQLPAVNKLLRQWVYNDQPLPSGLPSDLASFIDKARQLPSWADLSRITAAAQFGQAHMSYLALAYSMGVSTAAFTYPILASVFDPNVGIFLDFQKRLLGSLKLISGVYDPNAFGPHGQIIPDLIKVRLMHAAVRDYLDDSRWDRAKWGVAISQEAMLVETWLFGVFALNAMQGFGVQIPTDIATDFLHTWRVEGTMLGVPAGAMPTDLPTANALFSQLEDRDQWSSPQGRYLLNTFINQAGKYMSGPGGVDISPILISVIRCALGPRLADMLGVPKSLWDDEVDPALHNLQATTTENAGPLSWFVQVINDLLGDNVQMVTLKGEPVYLDIPSYRIPARASLPGGRHGSADLSGDTRRERFRSGARRAPRRARPAVRVQVQGVHRRQLGAGR